MNSTYISPLVGLALAGLVTNGALAHTIEEGRSAGPERSAPISHVAYEVTFDESTAPFRQISVAMSFRVAGSEPVILSLPAWTPGSYELDNYARNVLNFHARSGETALRWDKVDWDTWRVFPAGAENVTVTFDYRADAMDTGSAWTASDFAFFNGTNLFLYPEGRGAGFSSRVTFRTEPDWSVATGMTPGSGAREYVAADFHELVDMPTFIGRFDVDSAEIDGVLHRLATYPAGFVTGERREGIWDQLRGMMAPMAAVFDETPFETYTTLMVLPEDFGGASALEHRNSHLGIYTPQLVGSPVLPSIVAHEIFHAWNVKRLRPAPLVPYDYGRPQPTTLLWVSEGITSYYDDLSLVRGGVYGRDHFYRSTADDIGATEGAGAVALEDASLTAWIDARDGSGRIYYPKGAVAGFLLDILIRNATNNEASLDDVMRELYWRTYKKTFTGFSEAAWWATVNRIAGGASFDNFYARYVDGREPYPWDEVLPLAGLTLHHETTVRPLVGIFPVYDSLGVRVNGLSPGGAAADGGVRESDYLLRAGPVELGEPENFDDFRAHFSKVPEGTTYEVVVRRGAEELTLELELRLSEDVQYTLVEDPDASPRAVRIRQSILEGR
jgi:predicted metalloprotease with PDZ domain